MGELVNFRPRTDIIRRRVGVGELGAEILFFTGVRIIRVEEADAVSKGDRRPAVPRGESARKRRNRKS